MTTMNNEDPDDPSVHEARELPEPAAWRVYFPDEQREELASSLDELCDDLTNCAHDEPEPLYTADQMREAIAAERERSHELLQAADHIRAGLEAKLAALRAAVDESERERDYLRWRMREIIPLFEEARDALCAISLVAATAYSVDLSLGSRMDAAGTRTREEFDAMLTAAEKEQPK